ncbi:MAG TPA: hypothetical protein VGG39_13020 [Polyangiaceae bacterium]|jgi:hypothetical protein
MNGADTGTELVALTRWLQKQVGEKRSRVVLRQRIEDGANQLVREWRLADIVPSELATAIYERAIEDATQQRGPVQYGLFAYAEGQKSYVDRTFLNVDAPKTSTAIATLDATTFDDDERAQRAGVVGMLMKHTHASAQLALGQTVDIVRHYKEESERKDARIRELEERQTAVLQMYEELLSAKHERELEMLKAQNSEKRKDHLLDKLDMLVPIAMSKILPASKTPALGEELMRQLLKSLSRDQLSALVSHLSPEQAALIHEIYIAYCEREEQRDAKKNGANGHTNGVNGTAGGAGGHA